MSRSAQHLQEAADWLTRLQRPEVDETDWLAFDAWLSEPGAQEAYDAIQAVDEEIFQRGPAVRGHWSNPGASRRSGRSRSTGVGWAVWAPPPPRRPSPSSSRRGANCCPNPTPSTPPPGARTKPSSWPTAAAST
ncbi:FecR/PupR family sigma factor regulator [Caulobacter segnis]